MLSELNIVKGAVAKKDLSPVLKHLKISQGWVTATNGRLTISTPIPELGELDVIVPADKFIKAVSTCKVPRFKVTDGGRLSITDGKFRALVPILMDVEFPTPRPQGDLVTSEGFFEGLDLVYEFIGNDASRLWACGVLFHDGFVYATNNTVIARANIGWSGPSLNIPSFLVDELRRIKKRPIRLQSEGGTVTIELEDNVWINSVLLPMNWPNAKALFDKADFSNVPEVPEGLSQAIRDIVEFCPDKRFPKINFVEDQISTDSGAFEAAVHLPGLPKSIWRAEPLLNLLEGPRNCRVSIDFSRYPSPCPWIRENGSEGLIIGLRA